MTILLNRYQRLRLRASIGQAISSLENFTTWNEYEEGGLFPGLLRETYPKLANRCPKITALIDSSLCAKGMDVLSLLSAVTCGIGIKSDRLQAVTAASNALTHTYGRIRNGYGRDGSDEMQELIAWYDILLRINTSNSSEANDVFLAIVNLQLIISYTASGLIKAVSEPWRSGDAFLGVMRTKSYGHRFVANLLEKSALLNLVICWQTILWESFYPAAYLLPKKYFKIVMLFTELFHLAIGYWMGLPRFFWVFGAAHEAAMHVKDKKD